MATTGEGSDASSYPELLREGHFEEALALSESLDIAPETRQELGLSALIQCLLGGEDKLRRMIREGRRDDLMSRSLVNEGLARREQLGWPKTDEDMFCRVLCDVAVRLYESTLCVVSD